MPANKEGYTVHKCSKCHRTFLEWRIEKVGGKLVLRCPICGQDKE